MTSEGSAEMERWKLKKAAHVALIRRGWRRCSSANAGWWVWGGCVSCCQASMLSDDLRCVPAPTCRGDPREDPALSVRHRVPVGRVVLPQDLHAAAPRRRGHPPGVIPSPVPHQDPIVILGVDLKQGSGWSQDAAWLLVFIVMS